ncbi:MAG: hotdog domain-containing protein [Alphaproteobacteria bacterium]
MAKPGQTDGTPRIAVGAPFLGLLGLDEARAIPGGVRLVLAHRADNANRNGTLHGGVIASLVETAGALALERDAVDGGGAAALAASPADGPRARGASSADVAAADAPRSPWSRPTAVDLSIHFVAPAIECDVVAEAHTVRRGRAVGFADVAVTDADGAPIARGLLAARAVGDTRRGGDDERGEGGASVAPGATPGVPAGDGLPASHREALERLSFSRFSGSAFSARLQVRSARIPGAGVVALLPWQDLLADEAGQVHAGAIATLVDAAGGASAWTAGGFDPRGRASTIAMHMTVARAPAGEDLVAIAQPPWRTGELFSIAVEVATRDRAEPVAWGSVVYRVVRPA